MKYSPLPWLVPEMMGDSNFCVWDFGFGFIDRSRRVIRELTRAESRASRDSVRDL